MVTHRCEKGCCTVTYCPLELSFGMTLHTFQGQSAGPVDEGQPPTAVDRVIVEPGTRTFEGNNPGTAYMALSRATTMGTGNLDSAIYFTGPNMNKGRVLDIKHQQSATGIRKLYKKIALREKWMARLEKNMIRPNYTTEYIEDVKNWCHQYRMSTKELDKVLAKRNWRELSRRATNY